MSKRGREYDVNDNTPQKSRAFVGSGPGDSRAGIYAGDGITTKNNPCSTLFVTQIPRRVTQSMVTKLFERESGFIGSRNVRNIYFIDFVTIPVASAAMRKYQGYKFPGFENRPGICIDYDKDPADKRSKQVEKQRIREFIQQDKRFTVSIHCIICDSKALVLRLLPPLSLPLLQRRQSDNSIVLDATQMVLEHNLGRAPPKPIFHSDGVEIRYSLPCKTCEAEIGYACVPHEVKIQYIFLHPHTIRAVDYQNNFTRVNPRFDEKTNSSPMPLHEDKDGDEDKGKYQQQIIDQVELPRISNSRDRLDSKDLSIHNTETKTTIVSSTERSEVLTTIEDQINLKSTEPDTEIITDPLNINSNSSNSITSNQDNDGNPDNTIHEEEVVEQDNDDDDDFYDEEAAMLISK